MLFKLTRSAKALLVATLLVCLPVVAEQPGTDTLTDQASATAVATLAPGSKLTPASGLAMSVASPNPVTVVLGLVAIVAFLFALAWLVRRMNPSALMGGQSMKVLGGLSVGPREKIILVEVGSQQVLLGVAPGRVSFIKDIPAELTASDSRQGGDFSNKLKHFMHKSKAQEAELGPSAEASPDRGVEQ